MAYDKQIAERVRPFFSRRLGFEEKKMFGGVGFLLYGNMCIGVWKELLIVRCGKEDHEEVLAKPHVRPFDITGRAMTGWVMIEPEGMEQDGDLESWIEMAIAFVNTLPAK